MNTFNFSQGWTAVAIRDLSASNADADRDADVRHASAKPTADNQPHNIRPGAFSHPPMNKQWHTKVYRCVDGKSVYAGESFLIAPSIDELRIKLPLYLFPLFALKLSRDLVFVTREVPAITFNPSEASKP